MSRLLNALILSALATGIAALGLAAVARAPRRLTASPAEPPVPGTLGDEDLDEAHQQQLLDELGAQLTG